MSQIEVNGWDNNRPYAHPSHSDKGYVFLGVKKMFGVRLSPSLGVDLDLARAQAVPIEAHNAFELFWQSHPTPSLEVAVLGLISNALNPKALQHTHPEAIAEFARLGESELFNQKAMARVGILGIMSDIEDNPQNYSGKEIGQKYHLNLVLMAVMLQHLNSDPSRFRVTEHGAITSQSVV